MRSLMAALGTDGVTGGASVVVGVVFDWGDVVLGVVYFKR